MLKWTCDAGGNWRQILVAVAVIDGRIVELKEMRRAA
jgi:hypothetical protein